MAAPVPAAKTALKALLEAWSWSGGTPVIRWGAPTESEDWSPELIYFGDAFDVSDENWRLGDMAHDQAFTLRIIVDVYQAGDDEQAAEQRAWDLFEQITVLLHQNHTLNGAINHMADRSSRQASSSQLQQWRKQILIEQQCVAFVATP